MNPTPPNTPGDVRVYSEEEINREINCYPVKSGVNKAGDIMRQLVAQVADLKQRQMNPTQPNDTKTSGDFARLMVETIDSLHEDNFHTSAEVLETAAKTIAAQASRIALLEKLYASEAQAKRERGDMIEELEIYRQRLQWLHTGGGTDASGCEWGVFRVKWDSEGWPIEVWQTGSDFKDLDAEIARDAALNPAGAEERTP
jgi:hypothetical protein